MESILVVDDEPVVLEVISTILRKEGFPVRSASTAKTAFEELREQSFDLLLCDIRLPDTDGLELLREVVRSYPGMDVVMMTGYGSLDGAIEAMGMGAADYLTKPLRAGEIVARIQAILKRRKLEDKVQQLQSELDGRYNINNIVADSPRMASTLAAIRKLTEQETPFVLLGESGAGRKFVARAVHASGRRARQNFLCYRTEVQSTDKHVSDLFGGLTEAGRTQPGSLEEHALGSVLIHAVEELSKPAMIRLGQALSTKQLAPPSNSDSLRPLRTRIMLSINAPLDELLSSGELPQELETLKEYPVIHLPRLEDRPEDLPGLISWFLTQHAVGTGKTLRCEAEGISLLQNQQYPGNVAQLFAILHQCANLSQGHLISAELVTRCLNTALPAMEDRDMSKQLGDREYQLVLDAVNRNQGQLDQAARELGISRTTLWRRMRKYNIRPDSTPRN